LRCSPVPIVRADANVESNSLSRDLIAAFDEGKSPEFATRWGISKPTSACHLERQPLSSSWPTSVWSRGSVGDTVQRNMVRTRGLRVVCKGMGGAGPPNTILSTRGIVIHVWMVVVEAVVLGAAIASAVSGFTVGSGALATTPHE
jgi:hypothetical protein